MLYNKQYMTSTSRSQDQILKQEASLYSRYLIDRDPPQEMIERYISANRKLGIDVISPSDADIMQFSMVHPWSIPFLDAAAGFLQPDSLLRKKIYTMAAVLEASTKYTEDFLPQALSPAALAFQLITNSLKAGIKIIVGIPLLLFLRSRRHD